MKTYIETEESNLKRDAATNLRDQLLIHMLFRSVGQQAVAALTGLPNFQIK